MYAEMFKDKIKSARIQAGYTQVQVAKLTGISQAIISNMENGNREPSLENFGILADFYEVSADWLLGTGIKKK